MLNHECCDRYTPTASSFLILWRDLERGAGVVEDKTVLRSRRACGDLEYSSLRDSIRADAYAGRRKQKCRSHSLLTCCLTCLIFKNWLKLPTIWWLFLNRTDYPATFAEPWVVNRITRLTITGSSNFSAAIVVEMLGCQEKSVEKVSFLPITSCTYVNKPRSKNNT